MLSLDKLGVFFRENREASGLTLEQVAATVETLSPESLAAFEDGTGSLGVDDLFALTNILNIDPEEFLARLQPSAMAALEDDVARRLSDENAASGVRDMRPVKISGLGKPK